MIRITKSPDRIVTALFIILGLCAAGLIWYATAAGPWAYSDSVAYLAVADSFLKGHGLGMPGPSGAFRPLLHYPPLYPLLLSFGGLFQIPLVAAARWLNVILFVGLICSLAAIVYHVTRSILAVLLSCVLLVASPILINIYAGVMSDPLALSLGFAGLCALFLYLENRKQAWLLAAGFLSSLACLTRYVSLAFILSGGLALLFLSSTAWKRRLIDVLEFGLASTLLPAAWLVWVYTQSHTLGNRSLESVGDVWAAIISLRASLADIFWTWLPFAPPPITQTYRVKILILLFILIAIVGVSVACYWLARRQQRQRNGQGLHSEQIQAGIKLTALLGLLIVTYLLTLVYSVLFTVPTPDVNNRTLTPVFFAGLAATVIPFFLIARLPEAARPRLALGLRLLVTGGVLAATVASLPQASALLASLHQDSAGYNSAEWRSSPTLQAIRSLPLTVPIVTNESALVLFQTGRTAYDISELLNNQPEAINLRYGEDLKDGPQRVFREQGAALVLFDTVSYSMSLLYKEDGLKRIQGMTQGLFLYQKFSDGAIYFYQAPKLN